MDEVVRKRCVMEGIEPVPRGNTFVIIVEDPLESLDVTLADPVSQVVEISFIFDIEFLGVISHFIAINSQLDGVDISGYMSIVLCV